MFGIAAFISALFLLEFGADKFIDHATIAARRTGVPETIIGLLTAGAEWEEVSAPANKTFYMYLTVPTRGCDYLAGALQVFARNR